MQKLGELNQQDERGNLVKLETKNLVEKLSSQYRNLGIEIDATTGKVKNLNEVMAKKASQDYRRQLKEIDAELEQLKSSRDKYNDIIENSGVHIGSFQIGGGADVEKSLDKLEGINAKISELRKQRNAMIKDGDPAKRLKEEMQARAKDTELAFNQELSLMLKEANGNQFDTEWVKRSEKYHQMMAKATTEQQRKMIQAWYDAVDATAKEAHQYAFDSLSMDKYDKALHDLEAKIKELKAKARNAEELKQIEEYRESETARIEKEKADAAEAEAKRIADEEKKLADAEIAEAKKVADAKKAYMDALEAYRQQAMQREMAAYDRQISKLESKAEKLQNRLDKYAFAGIADNLITNDLLRNNAARQRKAKQQAKQDSLDERIAEKLQRLKSGERVSFSSSENRRIRQYNADKKEAEKNNAQIKQIEAAKKQLQAGETALQAAKAQQQAAERLEQAARNLGTPVQSQMPRKQTPSRQQATSTKKQGTLRVDSLKVENLRLLGQRATTINYTPHFARIHNDLMRIMQKAYIVK